jgi:hypothetical protein
MTAAWPLPHQALAVFRAGNVAEALAIADGVLADDPCSADALLTRAMIRLARGAMKDAIPDLRAAAELRSGEWLLERLRVELMARSRLSFLLEDAMKLGSLLRSRLSPVGPVLSPARRTADHEFVNIVGTSFVRSFGGNTCFFPVFVGMGPGMLLLSDEASAITRNKMLENLKRVDLSRPTVLTIGSDAYYHIENILKMRKNPSAPVSEEDYALMELVAERHRPLLAAAKKLVKGPLLLLCSTPTQEHRVNVLSHHLNQHLATVCRETGVEFLDWWADLADPVTDRLADKYSAKAYPGDIHFTLETTGLFVKRLQDIGVLTVKVPAAVNYEWSHVFECDIGVGEKTRIWCEPNVSPNNAVKSHKIASSHVYGKLADLLTAMLIASGPQSALYVNVREGYLPTVLPAALISRSVALTRSANDARLARAVLDFWGRSDVALRHLEPGVTQTIAGFEPSLVVGATYPETREEDIAAINGILAAERRARMLALLLIDPADAARIDLKGYQLQAKVLVGHRYVPPAWQQTTLFLFARNA